MSNTLSKKAAQFIKLGATGKFEWLGYATEAISGKETLHREKRGSFKVVETRSNAFVISAEFEDGTQKPRIFCTYPAQKKTRTSSEGLTEEWALDLSANGFVEVKKETWINETTNIKFRNVRAMQFNP